MLRRNLKRQASRSLSAFAVSSPRAGAVAAADADQENLHPNLAAASPPMSPAAKNSSAAPGASPRSSKPVPTSAAPPSAEGEQASAPANEAPAVKVKFAGSPEIPFLPSCEPLLMRERSCAGGGPGAADGEPAGGRQGSVLRPQDLPLLRRRRRSVVRRRWLPRRQSLSGLHYSHSSNSRCS